MTELIIFIAVAIGIGCGVYGLFLVIPDRK